MPLMTPWDGKATPRMISFDLDGTLLDDSVWQPTIVRTCERLGREFGLDASRLSAANAEVWSAYWPTVESAWTLGQRNGASVTEEAWALTLECAGYDREQSVAASAVYQEERISALRLYPDVDRALAGLAPLGALVLITNGASDTQRLALNTLGIEGWFASVVVSGEVGVAKPDPQIFDIALQSVGVEPERAWHVGDGLLSDVAGARAAGVRSIWLNRAGLRRPDDLPRPDTEIGNLDQLVGLVTS